MSEHHSSFSSFPIILDVRFIEYGNTVHNDFLVALFWFLFSLILGIWGFFLVFFVCLFCCGCLLLLSLFSAYITSKAG